MATLQTHAGAAGTDPNGRIRDPTDLTRRWHPSRHWKKWKSRDFVAGNSWNVKREDLIDIVWDFSLNQ